jgi:ubiquinone/menaquinone biosynthesis C-methylase UbiE
MEDSLWKTYYKESPALKSNHAQVRVMRTKFGVPISEDDWKKTVNFLKRKLRLSKNKRVLDLCCGNGLLSLTFAKYVKEVLAIDFTQEMIEELNDHQIKNIHTTIADANTLKLTKGTFDIIIIYFAIQHFDRSETVRLIKKAKRWLKKGGIIYIGDIPNEQKVWDFFYKKEFRFKYFEGLVNSQPVLGTWFFKSFFLYLGEYLGFKKVEIIKQKKYMINNHYRFDVLMQA